MRLKTYRAYTMGDALAQVKKDLGRDAVILHTRSFKVGGWFGFGGKPVVEITASDTVNVMPRNGSARAGNARRNEIVDNSAPPKPQIRSVAPESAAAPAAMRAYSAVTGTPQQPIIHRPHRAAREHENVPTFDSSAAAQSFPELVRQNFPERVQSQMLPDTTLPARAPAVDEELAAIKKMIGQVLQSTRHTAFRAGSGGAATIGAANTHLPDPLVQHYLKLIESEVTADLADEVIGQVRDELTTAELSDASIVHETLLRRLAALVPSDPETPRPGRTADGRPLTIALVGPTGVGKTTTVAKLAAAYKLRHGKRVGLITTDTYRIAAVDQLRTYAEIIGLPLKVAMSPTEMASVCESLQDCDVILIDTAGRSQRDSDRLEELRQFIEAARPHQTHLVLSSTASESVLVEAAQKFALAKPDRIIFTKVDEAVNFGVLVTVAHKVALKLSYLTTGQEVPDHIEVGRPERIARLLLDGREAK